jgi:hypothetical protein
LLLTAAITIERTAEGIAMVKLRLSQRQSPSALDLAALPIMQTVRLLGLLARRLSVAVIQATARSWIGMGMV